MDELSEEDKQVVATGIAGELDLTIVKV